MNGIYYAVIVIALTVVVPLAIVGMQIKREYKEGFIGEFDQFRKCTTCDWADQSPTSKRDRHICPVCGASTKVAVGRWVLEGNGPIRFDERRL